jgi:ABC-type tungstate transport system permease subunit
MRVANHSVKYNIVDTNIHPQFVRVYLPCVLLLAACTAIQSGTNPAGSRQTELILAATTSTRDSGLLDELVPSSR